MLEQISLRKTTNSKLDAKIMVLNVPNFIVAKNLFPKIYVNDM